MIPHVVSTEKFSCGLMVLDGVASDLCQPACRARQAGSILRDVGFGQRTDGCEEYMYLYYSISLLRTVLLELLSKTGQIQHEYRTITASLLYQLHLVLDDY